MSSAMTNNKAQQSLESAPAGKILVADHQGVYVIKMVGDVRLTLCVPFDDYIETLFAKDDFCAILFDLSEVSGVDSTTLGLMAKIAIRSNEQKQISPLLISDQPSINRLLESMSLTSICRLINTPPADYCQAPSLQDTTTLAHCSQDELVVKTKVLESHCVLMSLSANNHETFKDLVQTLERA